MTTAISTQITAAAQTAVILSTNFNEIIKEYKWNGKGKGNQEETIVRN